jgi:hypothetical protein
VCGLVRAQVVFSKNDLPAGELTSKVIRQRRKKKIWEKGGGERGEGRGGEGKDGRTSPIQSLSWGRAERALLSKPKSRKILARWTPVTPHPALLHSLFPDYCAYTTLYRSCAAFCLFLFYFILLLYFWPSP